MNSLQPLCFYHSPDLCIPISCLCKCLCYLFVCLPGWPPASHYSRTLLWASRILYKKDSCFYLHTNDLFIMFFKLCNDTLVLILVFSLFALSTSCLVTTSIEYIFECVYRRGSLLFQSCQVLQTRGATAFFSFFSSCPFIVPTRATENASKDVEEFDKGKEGEAQVDTENATNAS